MNAEKITVLGANITGKTTMIWNMADMLRGTFRPGEVECKQE